MIIYYNLLNLIAINALCIYKVNQIHEIKRKRIDFIQNVLWGLIKSQTVVKSTIEILPVEIWRRAKIVQGKKQYIITETETDGSQGRYYECEQEYNYKKVGLCKCKKYICSDHLKLLFNCIP